MTDNDALMRVYGIISRRERRERVKQALAVIEAARKKGLPVKAATIEGVVLELGEPETAPATNEWDLDLYGTPPPQTHQ